MLRETTKPLGRSREWATKVGPFLPGLAIFWLLWLITYRSLDWVDWVDQSYSLWQVLGREFLKQDPIQSLLALHTQPPGLNALLAVDLWLTPSGHQALAAMFAAGLAASVVLVVHSLILVGIRRNWAALTGVVYALLPSTVLYSLWPFSTGPTIFACALSLWGVALAGRHMISGVFFSATGVVLLFLFRSSFVWVFVLLWLLALGVYVVRASMPGRKVFLALLILASGATVVVTIQVHYLLSYGLWSTSSWTGENQVKALFQSGNLNVQPEAIRDAELLGTCHGSLAQALADGVPIQWNPGLVLNLPGCAEFTVAPTSGVPALDSPAKDGRDDGAWSGNFNSLQRLQISTTVSQVMWRVIWHDPTQILRMALTGGVSGSRDSGLAIYLAPSDDFSFVTPIRAGYPNKTFGGILSLFFAPAVFLLCAASLPLLLSRRKENFLRRTPLYFFSLGLLVYHLGVSVLGEYGENNRFQAEVAPAAMVMVALVVRALWPSFKTDDRYRQEASRI